MFPSLLRFLLLSSLSLTGLSLTACGDSTQSPIHIDEDGEMHIPDDFFIPTAPDQVTARPKTKDESLTTAKNKEEVPEWCYETYEVDRDCDGWHDTEGYLL